MTDSRIIEAPDLAILLKEHQDAEWVAIAADYSEVVATADTLEELRRITNEDRTLVVVKVRPLRTYYVPTVG